jgi:predicted nucleotide-binding protein (sugar kinase/HSP70/actin superfamily)
MPSGTGPCRFGQYNVFHKQVLESIGIHAVPIIAPNQDTEFYRDLGVVGNSFAIDAWKGIIAVELLTKCLHESRPYEAEPGGADRLYNEYLGRLYKSVRGVDGRIEDVLKGMRKDFSSTLPGGGGELKKQKPLIGIVGEIFVRSNKFSNEDLVKKIEALGGEAWLAPVEEWIYYVNRMGLRKSWIRKDRGALKDYLIKDFVQKRIEHKYRSCFKGFLRTMQEPETSTIMRKAAPYVHDSFEGETILSVGKSVDLAQKGVSGIVNAMPFGCMPGTIVTALLRGISRDFKLPVLSMPYDGTESSTSILQLEAFMDQARGRHHPRSALRL